ncbi:MAG TPA: hypothetical protein VGZ47_19425 [Gemmataceae bacterium]|jgi:hypothetical protein|nr:hypothetical protein [Gemmataceae bacterium]
MAGVAVNQNPQSVPLRRHSLLGIIACALLLATAAGAAFQPFAKRQIISAVGPEYHDDPKAVESFLLVTLYSGVMWVTLIAGLIVTFAALLHCFIIRPRPKWLFPLLALPLLILAWLALSN